MALPENSNILDMLLISAYDKKIRILLINSKSHDSIRVYYGLNSHIEVANYAIWRTTHNCFFSFGFSLVLVFAVRQKLVNL